MATVKPLKGVLYNYKKLKMADVVAPPYDVIDEKQQEELYKKSEFNVIRLILGKIYESDDENNNRYTRAAEYLNSWIKEGILTIDEDFYFYVYKQKFKINDKEYERLALIGRVKLEEFDKKIILPHEKTLSAPKEDRFKLLSTTKASLSPIFGIVLEDGKIADLLNDVPKEFMFEFEDENNVSHEFYRIKERSYISRIENLFKGKKILIADGHHRYETALRYRNLMKTEDPNYSDNAPYNYTLMAIVSVKDPGLVILPTHRVIKNVHDEVIENAISKIKKLYNIKKEGTILDNTDSIVDDLKNYGKRHFSAIWLDDSDQLRFMIFEIKDTSSLIDVELLHKEIINRILKITDEEVLRKEKIEYYKDIKKAVNSLKDTDKKLVLCFNPPDVSEIERLSMEGRTMPQKSTFFFPKFYSGLIIYKFHV